VLATIKREKGQRCVINAVYKLIQMGLNIELFIAGDTANLGDEYKEELRTLIDDNGINSHVHLLGWREDNYRLLENASVLVLSSWSEGMPLCIMEAMSMYVPVISTPVGSVNEMLNEGNCGWIFPIDNDQVLADIILKIMNMPSNELKLYLQRAYDNLKNNYSIESQITKLKEIFI
jgi:glycosyltransferase involved in cell wall biosynthesis